MPVQCDEFMKIAKYFLIAGGFWPFKITENVLKAKMYNFYCKIQTISYVTFISSLLLNICILLTQRTDRTRIFAAINIFVVVFETCVKILIFQIKKVPDMFEHTMNHERYVRECGDQDIVTCYQKNVDYTKKVNISQFLMTLFCILPFTLISMIEFCHSENWSQYKDKPFMHDLWYPFTRENHMVWVIFLNMILISQGTCFNTATQVTFINLMMYASCRFTILQIKLQKLDGVAKKENNGDVMGAVKNLIVEHQKLIRFVASLNERTKYVMLLEFLLNALSLAAGLIQIVVVSNKGQVIIFFTIIFMQLFQVFILAWSANEISIQGLNVAGAIAASNWHTQPVSVQKLFLVMIRRAQVPATLTVGPFFPMSLHIAVTTVKAAYTYLSVMLRNYDTIH